MMRTGDVSREPTRLSDSRKTRSALGLILLLLFAIAPLSLVGCAGYTSNAANNSGSGVGGSGGGTLSPSSATIAFGNIAVGSAATQSVTVTNTGTGTVNISSASVSGGVFTVVGGSPNSTLSVGQSATVQVQFAPTSMTPATGALTVTSNATNSTLSIALSGTGLEAVPSFSPGSLNFNNVTVGQTSAQNLTVNNTGNTNLSITAATVSGAGFGISGFSLPATVGPNSSTTFSVQFTPQSTTAANGSIVFTDNGPGSTQTFTMTGSAVAAGSTLGANPGSYNFNSVTVGSNGTEPITLTNSGNTTITISSISASGAGFTESGVSNGQTIAAGGTATVNAVFTPTSAGIVSGSITINSNATNSPLVIGLSGTGTQAAITANPSSINFGSILVGNSASVNVTLTNSGTANLNITAASASGTGFSMGSLSSTTLNPGGTATFTATFAPAAPGSASGSISVTSNAPGSPLVIHLSGVGTTTQAQLVANPTSVNFNNVNLGSNSSENVTLTNTGNATLDITAATISGTGYTMSLEPTTIGAGGNTTFSVTFTPTASGSASGSITITSNAPTSPTTISLAGTGVEAEISATPSTITFGTVAEGNTDSEQITLHNGGNATLTFSQITVSGTGFSQTGLSTSTTIPAGGSANFNATFDPTSTSPVTGTITLTTNGTPSSLVINLSGTGQAATALLGANPTSLSFGGVLDKSTSSLTTAVTNSGNSSVTVSAVTVTGAGFTASGMANGTVLTAGQSATLTVTFAPASGGAVSGASVSIASNATNSPLSIGLTGTGLHSVALNWGASSTDGVTYNVFKGTSSGGESTTPINTSPVTSLSYTDTNVTPGTDYYYYVEAVDSGGSSTPSNEAVADVPNP
jgi:Abnormal spindle-like microcephaly-assoc'd, ASPM-SPD-2-Hydin